jgi:hypothetical protein
MKYILASTTYQSCKEFPSKLVEALDAFKSANPSAVALPEISHKAPGHLLHSPVLYPAISAVGRPIGDI